MLARDHRTAREAQHTEMVHMAHRALLQYKRHGAAAARKLQPSQLVPGQRLTACGRRTSCRHRSSPHWRCSSWPQPRH